MELLNTDCTLCVRAEVLVVLSLLLLLLVVVVVVVVIVVVRELLKTDSTLLRQGR